jgi:hypothetical protein
MRPPNPLTHQSSRPFGDGSAIRHFSNSDNRSTAPLPIGSNPIEDDDALIP